LQGLSIFYFSLPDTPLDIQAIASSPAQTPARIERISSALNSLDAQRASLNSRVDALSNDTAIFVALLTAATLANALQATPLTIAVTIAASIVFISKRRS
jgi:hypothetical protein